MYYIYFDVSVKVKNYLDKHGAILPNSLRYYDSERDEFDVDTYNNLRLSFKNDLKKLYSTVNRIEEKTLLTVEDLKNLIVIAIFTDDTYDKSDVDNMIDFYKENNGLDTIEKVADMLDLLSYGRRIKLNGKWGIIGNTLFIDDEN